jgi:hypothetical protein
MNNGNGDPDLPLQACENPNDHTRDPHEWAPPTTPPHDGQPVTAGDPVSPPSKLPPGRRVPSPRRRLGWRDREGSLDGVRPDRHFATAETVLDPPKDPSSG